MPIRAPKRLGVQRSVNAGASECALPFTKSFKAGLASVEALLCRVVAEGGSASPCPLHPDAHPPCKGE